MTFTGTLDAINAALDGMTFTPVTYYTGPVTLNLALDDNGSTGAGGPQTTTAQATARINPINQPPTLAVPTTQSLDENGSVTFSVTSGNSIVLTDVDSGGGLEFMTLSVTHGAISLTDSSGLSWFNNTHGGSVLNLQGTVAGLNAALNSLVYTAASGYFGGDTLGITANDNGNTGPGGARQVSASVPLTIGEVNQPPVVNAPSSIAGAENAPSIFSSSQNSAITVADVDANGAIEQVSLATTSGTLWLGTTAGLSFINGTQNGQGLLVFTGTLANLNAALDGLQYVPAPDAYGVFALDVTQNDLGNTGIGGSLSATKTVNVHVQPISYQPSITNTAAAENQQTSSGLVITPNPLDGSATGYYQITGIVGGSLYLNDGTTAITNGQFITFSQGSAGLKFSPAPNSLSAGGFTIEASATASSRPGAGEC